MAVVGGLILVYPPFLSVILGWGLIVVGGSIVAGAYRKGVFDKQIAEIKDRVESAIPKVRL
jgi:hypothetical protein